MLQIAAVRNSYLVKYGIQCDFGGFGEEAGVETSLREFTAFTPQNTKKE